MDFLSHVFLNVTLRKYDLRTQMDDIHVLCTNIKKKAMIICYWATSDVTLWLSSIPSFRFLYLLTLMTTLIFFRTNLIYKSFIWKSNIKKNFVKIYKCQKQRKYSWKFVYIFEKNVKCGEKIVKVCLQLTKIL